MVIQIYLYCFYYEEREDLSLAEDDQVTEHLNELDIHKAMGPDGSWLMPLQGYS